MRPPSASFGYPSSAIVLCQRIPAARSPLNTRMDHGSPDGPCFHAAKCSGSIQASRSAFKGLYPVPQIIVCPHGGNDRTHLACIIYT
ncbi:unnamed protein product [Periconia digitata]|uniref:Uncharacterized protein n=1 Tax=Periconia digitata TaxID=1303443 RepID=A0A9W4XXE9_9PLEO|nr:unnamed protein product [Periconia digitata]